MCAVVRVLCALGSQHLLWRLTANESPSPAGETLVTVVRGGAMASRRGQATAAAATAVAVLLYIAATAVLPAASQTLDTKLASKVATVLKAYPTQACPGNVVAGDTSDCPPGSGFPTFGVGETSGESGPQAYITWDVATVRTFFL